MNAILVFCYFVLKAEPAAAVLLLTERRGKRLCELLYIVDKGG